MPTYNYECNSCKAKAYAEHSELLENDSQGEKCLPRELYEELILFETEHSLRPSEKELYAATECPRCNGHDCTRTMYGTRIHSYVRGYGWKDRVGARRDMNRYKLANDDPYAEHREHGEAEYLDNKLKKEGQYNPHTTYFVPTASDTKTEVKPKTKAKNKNKQ